MDVARIDAVLSVMSPEEIQDALWFIGVFERWVMPVAEAYEWRRRIVATRAFLRLHGHSSVSD